MARSPLLTALFHPLNLAMLGLTAAAGLCGAWWLAPVGILFWLIMVIVVARDPGLKITFMRASRQPLAQRFQTRFDRLDRARVLVFNAMQRCVPPARKAIEPVQIALDQLVEHIFQLSLRMSSMDNNYAVQRATSNFDSDIADLNKKRDAASDAASRKEYDQALQSLKNGQAQLKRIDSLMVRFETQLTGANSSVDSLVTGVVGLQGLNLSQTEERIPSLIKLIETQEEEFRQFDTELENSPALE